MAVCDQQMFDEIFILHGGCCPTPATSPLSLIGIKWLRFGVTLMRDRDHQIFFRDKVFDRQVFLSTEDLAATIVAVCLTNFGEFLAQHLLQALARTENILKTSDLIENSLIIIDQLALFQGGQTIQAQL